jgi:hypothetical protein
MANRTVRASGPDAAMQTDVALVVCTTHLCTGEFVQAGYGLTDGVAHEVTNVERLEGVWLRMLNEHTLATEGVVRSPPFTFSEDGAYGVTEEKTREMEVDEAGTCE